MKALHSRSAAELGRALDSGELSSVELTKHLLARVSDHQQLGAFLCTDEAAALRQAAAAPPRPAAGERGPRRGVPLAHNDN